jgi:hypothetical protein
VVTLCATKFNTEQDRQWMHEAALRRVCESFLLWKSNKYFIFVCVCARTRECARARGHVHVALLIQHANHTRHIVTSFGAPLAPPCFPTLSKNQHDLKKVIHHKMCILFFLQLLSKTFPITENMRVYCAARAASLNIICVFTAQHELHL